jgi:hypothetical protein
MSFPLSKCTIKSKFSVRYSSFITLTILLTIRSSSPGKLALPLSLSGTHGCTLFTKAINGKFLTLNLGSLDGKYVTQDGPILELNIPTLITLKVLRKNEIDPNSIEGIKLGAASVIDLQRIPENRKILKESSPLAFPGLTSTEPLYFRIQSENVAFDLYWIHMFDYIVDADNLYREARADWGYLPWTS